MGNALKKGLTVAAVMSLAAAIGYAQSPQDLYSQRPNGKGQAAGSVPDGVGTVTYDPGVPADVVVGTAGSTINIYGNLFNSRNGGPLSPGSVSRVSWYTGSAGFAPVWFALPGGTATYLGCCSATAPSAFNSAALALSVPSSFFMGFDVGGSGSFANIGLRSASTNGQGFHGRQRYSGAGASNVLSGQNSMVRVSGSLIVPVELMEFDLE